MSRQVNGFGTTDLREPLSYGSGHLNQWPVDDINKSVIGWFPTQNVPVEGPRPDGDWS